MKVDFFISEKTMYFSVDTTFDISIEIIENHIKANPSDYETLLTKEKFKSTFLGTDPVQQLALFLLDKIENFESTPEPPPIMKSTFSDLYESYRLTFPYLKDKK